MTNILTEYSAWYLLLCVAAGAGYAALLYTKKDSPWGANTNKALAALRFVLVTVLCILLLGLFVRQIENYLEKPAVVIAIDNSQSVPLVSKAEKIKAVSRELDALSQALSAENYQVDIRSLQDGSNYPLVDSIRFDQQSTNLSRLLKNIEQNYENRNLAGVVLLSDGIYNQGTSPLFMPYNMTIHSLGIGDTIPQTDLNLKAVYHNQIAYLGNRFPVVAEIQNSGFAGRVVNVQLKQNNEVLERKTINLSKDNDLQKLEFLVNASQKGMQHYVVEVQVLDGEFTAKNNSKHVYVDVLDSKEKILILAPWPHPDIKALRAALETKDNYEIDVYIPGLTPEEVLRKNAGKYDVMIFHQMPSKLVAANQAVRELLNQENTPVWYIVGSSTDLGQFNNKAGNVYVSPRGNQTDKVTPAFNANFNKFTFEEDKKRLISRYPPITVPFGNYRLAPGAEVLLYQRVGSVLTERPLLVVDDKNGRKSAALMGEGFWQWRIQEYAQAESQAAFDELVVKLVQYLSTREDKRRFRVYPVSREVIESESVLFETEVYNNIYERIYGQKINLSITNEQGKSTSYTYTNTDPAFKYRLSALPQGVYRYKATTELNGKVESSAGEFTVRELQMEAINTTADFNLLRQLSQQTGGQFMRAEDAARLSELLRSQKAKSIIHSNEEMREVIHLKWIFFVLVAMVAVEWFVRKFRGSY